MSLTQCAVTQWKQRAKRAAAAFAIAARAPENASVRAPEMYLFDCAAALKRRADRYGALAHCKKSFL
jgi:hypothetical protein